MTINNIYVIAACLALGGCYDDNANQFKSGAQTPAQIQKETYGEKLDGNSDCFISIYISGFKPKGDLALRAKLLTKECEPKDR